MLMICCCCACCCCSVKEHAIALVRNFEAPIVIMHSRWVAAALGIELSPACIIALLFPA